MQATKETKPASSAEGVRWNLGDLYKGVDDPAIDADLQGALKRAQAFEAAYRGKLLADGGPAADMVLAAVTELEGLYEQMYKPAVFAQLLHAADTADPKHGALVVRTQEQATLINQHLIFFDLEWLKLDDGPARTVLDHPRLAKYRHYLEHKRVYRPHVLSEPEEKLMERKDVTGRSAWVRLFDETTAGMRFPFRHGGKTQKLTQQEALSKLQEPDRAVRKAGAAAVTKGLRDNARLLTYLFNNLVLDHKTDCELRRYDDPMAPRHLANEIRPPVVEALMTAAERNFGTVQRYYALKAKLLGVGQLYDYDRYAPLFADMPACDWPKARQLVQESYDAFSPEAGTIVRQFFDKRWIDAEMRPGKRGGAFSAATVPSAHPYILMSFTDKLREVMTLAHELGHGVHQYLSRPVGYLQCHTPLTTAEMASVFGEMLTFQRLLEVYPEPRTRLAMLCNKIEDAFATVSRQVVLTRFEQSLHRARREQGELTAEQVNKLWVKANRAMLGKAVKTTAGYGWWWLYIGHFIHSPFYCYAYAFGELLVLALVQKYKQEGAAFVPKYLGLLASGGSDAPHVLLGKLGVDVNDPAFWELGLQLLDGMVTEAESLAARL
jgi:oligoendopeptidase F